MYVGTSPFEKSIDYEIKVKMTTISNISPNSKHSLSLVLVQLDDVHPDS
jgi:hypothetical protein